MRVRRGFIISGVLMLAALAALGGCALQTESSSFLVGPYKDLTLAIDRNTSVIATAAGGTVVPVTDVLDRGTTLTWAFATGECGSETLGGLDAQKVADANITAFNRAGINYIISTGGQSGVFTCGTDAGMEAFIARYASPRLAGIDFDIEAKQTPEMVDALVQRAVAAQRRHPSLRFSFTLPTLAASDGSRTSLVAQGVSVLEAIRRQGLDRYTINLMVMDYGPPLAANCVVGKDSGGNDVCAMGASAVQAAENLRSRHGIPFSQIELTPMMGVNDVAANDFGMVDAEIVAAFVREKGLAGLHFWSLDRDAPCARPASGASPVCSGMPGVPAFSFGRALRQGLR